MIKRTVSGNAAAQAADEASKAAERSSYRAESLIGTLGRRTSVRLIEAEAFRRIMSGAAPEMLDDFARQLSDWFRETYPAAPPPTPHAIEEQIRDMWHHRHDMIRGG